MNFYRNNYQSIFLQSKFKRTFKFEKNDLKLNEKLSKSKFAIQRDCNQKDYIKKKSKLSISPHYQFSEMSTVLWDILKS